MPLLRPHAGPRVAVALAVIASVAGSGVVSGACPCDAPEDILACFSEAHTGRDIEALGELMAPDYVWVVIAPPEADVFKRERSLEAAATMFSDPKVEWVTLEFGGDYRVVEGEEAETWRIEDVTVSLTVKHVSADQPVVASLCATLYVRLTAGEGPGYEVYREVFFEGLGCDDQ
jgi:hypothetical protein